MTSDPFEAGAAAAGAVAFSIDLQARAVAMSGDTARFGLNGETLTLDAFLSRMGPTDQDAVRQDLETGRIDVRVRLTGLDQQLSYVRLIGACRDGARIATAWADMLALSGGP